MNKWRSPTAEKLYCKKSGINARSAGTSYKARRHVSIVDIKWAEIVIAMESKHKSRLIADHPEDMRDKEVHVLEIEDNYRFMDRELIDELSVAIDPILEAYLSGETKI